MKKDHIVLGAPLAYSRMVAAERFKISPAGAQDCQSLTASQVICIFMRNQWMNKH